MAEEPAAPAAPGTPAVPPAAPAAPPAAPAADPAAPPAAPAAPAAPSGEKPWWDGKITEPEIVEYAKAKNYASPEEALRAAWSANKMNKLEPAVQAYLEGKATPEQEAAVLNKLRPETADKYEFKHADGVVVDKNLEVLSKNIFHKLGVPQTKAQEAMDMWNEAVGKQQAANVEANRVANEAALTDLAKTWGADLDKNKAAGDRVMKSLGLDPAFMEKVEAQIGSAAIVELLARIGRKSDEGAFKGEGSNPPGNPEDPNLMTPEQANAKAAALRSDPEFNKKYLDKNHAEHAGAVKLMEQLYAKGSSKPK